MQHEPQHEPMWRRYLRFWGPSVRDDVDDELRFHLETRADLHVRAGLSRADALARARAEFGDLQGAAAECREIGETRRRRRAWSERLDTLGRDLRHTLRALRRSPGYAVTVIATLALAIGLDTSVFTIVYAAAFRPLPVPDAARVVSVYQTLGGEYSREVNGSPSMVSLAEWRDYQQGARAFEGHALAAVAEIGLTLGGARVAPVAGRLVSCNYFGVLHVPMARGRPLAPDECAAPGGSPVAVVSHAFWRRALGGDARVLGSTLTLNRRVVTVVGVADSAFAGTELDPADLWLPVTMQPPLADRSLLDERNASWLGVLGRLQPGATREGARADLAAVARRADAAYPGRVTTVAVERGAYLADPAVRREGAAIAVVVLGAAGIVVLMACLNVMSLLLARAVARQRETGIRLALGAARARLVRQMLGEGAVLAAAGGAAGVAIAWWLPALLLRATPGRAPGLDLSPDARVIAWAALLALGTALAIALVPALQATRPDPAEALRRGRAPSGRSARGGLARTRTAVVGAQLAGSLLFLVLAALLLRGVSQARSADPGFRTARVVALTVDLARQGYAPARAAAFHATLRERVAAVPGVESVALAASLPLVARYTAPVIAEGADGAPVPAAYTVVTGAYFGTMGVSLVRGRAFGDEPVLAGVERPAVVSEALARRLWPATDALGGRFRSGGAAYRVVGVARDAQNVSLGERDEAFFYAAATRDELPGLAILVRTAGPVDAVAAALPRLVAGLDPQVLATTRSMEATLAELLRPTRAAALGATLLGALAAGLAAVGVYGIVAFGVRQRTREIGIRLALGAARRDVLADEVRRARRIVVPGLVAGLALAAAAGWAARGSLYGVSALDPLAFVGTTALLVVVAAVAVLVPARRAARLDPATSLRTD